MSKSRKILIVDDEPDIVIYFTMLLEEEGFEVVSASSADQGLELARKEKPDLICLDIMMPRKSGLACYREMRMEPDLRDTPVVIVSAFGQPQDFRGDRFRKLIADPEIPEPSGFVEKPIKPADFVQALRAFLA